MRNSLKKAGAIILAAGLCVSATSCKKQKTYQNDPETRPLNVAISTLDGTFNPFFSTTVSDGQVVGMTQISMISADNDGNVTCGENEPTVALDYKITSYDAANNVVTSDADHTTYEFVIKNGIKFSDGTDLTIKDVLFNLYVYLDPMYSGSSTIYSTNIRGLKAYRANNRNVSDDSDASSDSQFIAAAQNRINKVLAWATDDKDTIVEKSEIEGDIAKIHARFRKDLESDWNSNKGNIKDYEKEYTFTEDWQSFYLLEGLVQIRTKQNQYGNYEYEKNADGKYLTNLDDEDNVDAEDFTPENLKAYATAHNCSEEDAMKAIAIEKVYRSSVPEDDSEALIKSGLVTILTGMSTGSNIMDEFKLEEQSKFFENQTENIEDISGITTYKTSSFNGIKKAQLSGEHDVLSITINKIDPKAIWNFAFTVAPMHYYSNEEAISTTKYGVKARNKDFFDNVLASEAKNALPVGAGVYRASNEKGDASSNPAEVDSTKFWSAKKVYFQRNEYFETVGSGLNNAKIKYFTYQEVGENNILNHLIAKSIDYGNPGATQSNNAEVTAQSHLGSRQSMTNGYGYVGVNPKFVPDILIRRTIMRAMDVDSIITNYYVGGLAEPIYRPMTKVSWAYPTGCTSYYPFTADSAEWDKIESDIRAAGYVKGSDGVYSKDGKRLEYKFTIAGETTDHPAYAMFNKAANLLNQHGFKITVGTDVAALRKLATGNLAVWAAAWSSTIDPDMYQVYHKDSKATSRKNWDYDEILNPSNSQFSVERDIVNRLSDKIDEGRETDNQDERKVTYSQALDLVMQLAVELPTYQRNDLAVFNKEIIDVNTLNQETNLKYSSPIDRIWEVDYL